MGLLCRINLDPNSIPGPSPNRNPTPTLNPTLTPNPNPNPNPNPTLTLTLTLTLTIDMDTTGENDFFPEQQWREVCCPSFQYPHFIPVP